MVYIIFKQYPMDYVDGKLLVDPVKMMKDCFGGCGGLLGLIAACYIDRRWIHYEVPRESRYLAVATAVGLGLLFSWNEYFAAATVILMFGHNWGYFATGFISVMFAVAVYPLFIQKMCPPSRKDAITKPEGRNNSLK